MARPAAGVGPDSRFEFGPFTLEPGEHLLSRDGQSVPLPPKAFDVLLALVSRAGHLVRKEVLLREVWPETFVEEANLSYTVSLLRKALAAGEGGESGGYIETVPKLGYRFTVPVRVLARTAEPAGVVEFSGSRPDEGSTPVAPPATARAWWWDWHQAHGAAVIALGSVLALIVGAAWLWIQQSRFDWVRTAALPEAKRLFEEERPYAAFRLLRQAEAYMPEDPLLRDMLSEWTTPATIRTEPAGAAIYVRDFFASPAEWELLGHSPIDLPRLPIGTLVFKTSLEGFQTMEVLGFTPARTFRFSLRPVVDAPEGMVPIPGGNPELFSLSPVELRDYWIDKYEVTNERFKEFIDRGGYEKREYWGDPFVVDGVSISWAEARERFRDRTGRLGPATWELGTYDDGRGDYAVGGVSWYEAAAYCRSVGKQLPTFYHWYRAANLAAVTEFAPFGNFEAAGSQKVGQPVRLGAFGTYDMAGNVKEWAWNDADLERRYILGAGWNEPSYFFRDYDAQRPFDRQATYGIRCAKYPEPLTAALLDRVATPSRDYRLETPVDDEAFAIIQNLYHFDRKPLDSRQDGADDRSEHWRIERVSFAAAYGNERIPAQLFVPKNTGPPYQAVVWFPGGGAFSRRSGFYTSSPDASRFLFLVRSGRAVLVPMYYGSYDRYIGSIGSPSVWREVMIRAAQDAARAVDYLETRKDIDARKVAFSGLSMGAAVGPLVTAVEPRFRASILLGGGLYPWRRTAESEVFNYLPRVKVPTLMLNGKHDFFFSLTTSQEPMFRRLGTPLADKKHRLFESGHVPTERQEVMKETLDWLDRYLGPVERK